MTKRSVIQSGKNSVVTLFITLDKGLEGGYNLFDAASGYSRIAQIHSREAVKSAEELLPAQYAAQTAVELTVVEDELEQALYALEQARAERAERRAEREAQA
jgi:hypothetical protein